MSPLNSLLATFGLTAIIEAGIQYFWTADFRKLESVYSGQKLRVGGLFVPIPELLTLVLALLLGLGIWAAMRHTNLGRPPSASTGARTRCCWRARAARSPASPACASRCRSR